MGKIDWKTLACRAEPIGRSNSYEAIRVPKKSIGMSGKINVSMETLVLKFILGVFFSQLFAGLSFLKQR